MDPTEPYFQEARIKGTTIFDRPNWDAYARIEAHIDSKWSIYSENQFVGGRRAHVAKDIQLLRPIILLNIGGQYSINKWLNVYLQLNNYLNRKNDIFYGYQSQGCHFLLGVKYKF
jgi:outer membrane cobalamin receptor